jgi:ZIP family zinc transporter
VSSTVVAWILAAGLATSIGGLGVLLFRSPSPRGLDILLGFTAGIMLAATAFSLLVPALDRGSLWEVLLGFGLGGLGIAAADRLVPHLHLRFFERGRTAAEAHGRAGRRAGLLLSALTIHNVPEGMAVGVAFAAGGTELGVPIALAIGIQNIPEGFAAAAPLVEAGASRRAAALVAALTGLVEPPAAFAAFAAFELADGLLTGGLAFAAGAMLYVIADELIPESHARGHEREATLALLVGFALMMGLDNAFG